MPGGQDQASGGRGPAHLPGQRGGDTFGDVEEHDQEREEGGGAGGAVGEYDPDPLETPGGLTVTRRVLGGAIGRGTWRQPRGDQQRRGGEGDRVGEQRGPTPAAPTRAPPRANPAS